MKTKNKEKEKPKEEKKIEKSTTEKKGLPRLATLLNLPGVQARRRFFFT